MRITWRFVAIYRVISRYRRLSPYLSWEKGHIAYKKALDGLLKRSNLADYRKWVSALYNNCQYSKYDQKEGHLEKAEIAFFGFFSAHITPQLFSGWLTDVSCTDVNRLYKGEMSGFDPKVFL